MTDERTGDMNSSLNGVFAVNKPKGITSAQIVRILKTVLLLREDSKYYEKDIERARGLLAPGFNKTREKFKPKLKIGHGGTLDPLASGVLIIGVGKGTKQLNHYSTGDCVKTYQATALFGTSTTTYDSQGKILATGSTQGLKDEDVKRVMFEKFQGKIKQIPPIFSALKMNGKPLYEYARSGEPLPRSIEPRDAEISHVEFVDGAGGDVSKPLIFDHEYSQPAEFASQEEIEFSKKFQEVADFSVKEGEEKEEKEKEEKEKEEKEKEVKEQQEEQTSEKENAKEDITEQESVKDAIPTKESLTNEKIHPRDSDSDVPAAKKLKTESSDSTEGSLTKNEARKDPIIKFKLSVSSGTYIRSVIHDFARELGTEAHMVDLVRTNQGEWDLEKNVFDIEFFLDQKPSVWKEKLNKVLRDGPNVNIKEL